MGESKIVRRGGGGEIDFGVFFDASGSPGSILPITDLNGNVMADETKGIAYYGTVSHTDLFTATQLASEIGLTQGTVKNNESVWHKYYWNNGIHFLRRTARYNISWNDINLLGAAYGTGTTTSRKGRTTDVVQNAEVTKNGVNYAVRSMEGATTEDFAMSAFQVPAPTHLIGSEWNLILGNLHRATNTGSYVRNDSLYQDWFNNFDNNDFVGWVTSFDDSDFIELDNLGRRRHVQENRGSGDDWRFLTRNDMTGANTHRLNDRDNLFGWFPVLTVKHPIFTYE